MLEKVLKQRTGVLGIGQDGNPSTVIRKVHFTCVFVIKLQEVPRSDTMGMAGNPARVTLGKPEEFYKLDQR